MQWRVLEGDCNSITVALRRVDIAIFFEQASMHELARDKARETSKCFALALRQQRYSKFEHFSHEYGVPIARRSWLLSCGTDAGTDGIGRICQRFVVFCKEAADRRSFRESRCFQAITNRTENNAIVMAAIRNESCDRLAPLSMLCLGRELATALRTEELHDLLRCLARIHGIRNLDTGAIVEMSVVRVLSRVKLIVHELIHDLVTCCLIQALRNHEGVGPLAFVERKVKCGLGFACLQQWLQRI